VTGSHTSFRGVAAHASDPALAKPDDFAAVRGVVRRMLNKTAIEGSLGVVWLVGPRSLKPSACVGGG